MTTEASTDIGPAFSPEEDAFFASGGTTAIPEAGADIAGGDTGNDPPKPDADKPAADKVEKMVSLSALHEERAARKAAKEEARVLALEVAELKGKFSIIDRLSAPGVGEVEPAKVPTAEEDIFGAVKHVGETVAQMQKRLDDADAAAAATTKAEGERKTFVDNYKADATKFEATKPDYRQAYDFILTSRAAELQAIGYDTPEALHNALTADEFAIAEMAFAKGKSPAEMLYALAVQRGYKPGEKPADKPGKGAEKLDNIERGQALNKSLADTGGSAGDVEMTAATLIAMPMEEFEAWTAKNPAKAKRLMGG